MEAPRDTVVLGRANFEVLVQRANARNDYQLRDIPVPDKIGPLMCLPMEEYEGLVLSQRQYANLTRHLMQEGMTKERLTALSQDNPPDVQASKAKCKVPRPGQDAASTSSRKHREVRVLSLGSQALDNSAKPKFLPSGIESRFKEPWRRDVDGLQLPQLPQLIPGSQTTFYLKGLLSSVTYWDVTSVIRGGSLSNLRLASGGEVAFLSFVQEEGAMSFFDHVQKNGLFIQGEKIHVSWATRPYHVNSDLAAQIRKGASRNIVIRDCEGKLTESEIREDTEHIEKLVIIKVIFSDGHCHIKTNSIFDAMVAKMCMHSREKYKPWTIQWDHDECSEPFDHPQESHFPKQKATSSKKPATRGQNRFTFLRRDDNYNNYDTEN